MLTTSIKPTKTARLKLDFPGGHGGNPNLWNALEGAVIRTFSSNNQYIIVKDGERTKIGGDFAEHFYETTFNIQARTQFDENFFRTVSSFFTTYKELARLSKIVLCHANLFENRLICTMKWVPINRVSFGNIIENVFFPHWVVSFFHKNTWAGRNLKNPKLYNLTAHFDFDRPTPITVEFCVEENDGGNKVHATYCMMIDGKNIDKVVLGARDLGINRIYFVLNTPVLLKRSERPANFENHPCKKRPGENQPQSSPKTRVLQLKWGQNGPRTSSEKVLTENPIFCIEFDMKQCQKEIYSIVSRLRARWNVGAEFAYVNVEKLESNREPDEIRYDLLETNERSPYAYWTGRSFPMEDVDFNRLIGKLFPRVRPVAPGKRNKAQDKMNERQFSYVYLVEALLSRGSVVKDQLILFRRQWIDFLHLIETYFYDDEDRNLCESALEDLLRYVDGNSRVGNLLIMFEQFCKDRRRNGVSTQLTKEQWDEGYRRVRKVVITPTRLIWMIPETIMGNRTMNKYDHDGTRIIRSAFRDDVGGPLRYNKLHGHLKKTVLRYLRDGFSMNRRPFGYLGSSSSQMRDGGAYFYERYSKEQLKSYNAEHGEPPPVSFKPKIEKCRAALGDFEESASVPMAMARFGQTLTQARACEQIKLTPKDYKVVPDVCGGKNSNGKPYTFTDGIGSISVKLAEELARGFDFPNNFVPSAIQIRFRGIKGMLAVDPSIDERNAYFKTLSSRITNELVVKPSNREGSLETGEQDNNEDTEQLTCNLLFRKSQLKFTNRKGDKKAWPIELVKWSTPTTVTLNRPFINILDHVSAWQSLACHRRICERIQQLLDLQLNGFSRWIVDERSCRAKLEEMPRRVHFATLKENCGFSLSTEPFFRSLIKAAVDVSMMKLINKIQIQVPPSLGRTMFGVTDESGQLQYGQVFFQYTVNVTKKCPTKMTDKVIHTGKVLITKFPSTVPGDVRLFEAVDIPALRHLENVLVFPQSGPQPHPDEMAGSDLDGDEYAIIWDPLLFLERNEKPFEYSSEKPPKTFTKETMDGMMHEFFAEYLEQDSVGCISSTHLQQSDQFGLDSEVCSSLAKKGSMALDYAKSGVAPKPLTQKWALNSETNKMEPPERTQRVPDFAIGHNQFQFTPMYTSPRLLGSLFRGLRSVYEVVVSSTETQMEVVPDELIVCDGWEVFVPNAKHQMAQYNAQLRSLMENSGVRTEAEVFSGCIRDINNRFLDRTQDDVMSAYNAENILESTVTALFKQFREQFFAEFDDDHANAYMKFTEPENKFLWNESDQKDVLKRVCRTPTNQLMAKAVAYYKVCYDKNAPNQDNRLLSFAWIAYDILSLVKRQQLIVSEKLPETRHAQYEAIAENRRLFFEKNPTASFDTTFKRRAARGKTDTTEEMAMRVIATYTRVYKGLDKVLCVIEGWAKSMHLLRDETEIERGMSSLEKREILRNTCASRLQWYHLSLLFIMSVSDRASEGLWDDEVPVLENLVTRESEVKERVLSDSELDRLTFSFFHHLSSRRFSRIRSLNFSTYGVSSAFFRGEWMAYHKTAIKTYFNILLNMKFEEITTDLEPSSNDTSLQDGTPFIIELPKGVDILEIFDYLERKTNCTTVTGRLDAHCFDNTSARLLISSRGTVEALHDLRDLAAIRIPRYSWQLDEDISKPLALLTFYKITGYKWNEEEQKKKREAREAREGKPTQVKRPKSFTGSSQRYNRPGARIAPVQHKRATFDL